MENRLTMSKTNPKLVCHNLDNLATATEKGNCQTRPVRAAIYARVASLNQKSNHSINEQVACCRKHAEQRGWIVHYVFIDKGESGRTLDRPEFQLMLEKARTGFLDAIVVWTLDRFSRSLVDIANVGKTLREYGVALCSVTEHFDTTKVAELFDSRSIRFHPPDRNMSPRKSLEP
jgi:predicted site-specific integrase-resolvase